mgnify:CR=1 FL=1
MWWESKSQYVLVHPETRTVMAQDWARYAFPVPRISVMIDAFPDGEPNILVPDLHKMTGRNVVYLADWSSPAARYCDMCVLTALAERAPSCLTIVVPFMGSATMERETAEGVIATANIDAKLLSQLPCGNKRVVTVDLHTMQNQFFFYNTAVALKSCMPTQRKFFELEASDPVVFVFPDDGAHKRFASYFAGAKVAVCAKVRDGDARHVRLVEGEVAGCRAVIIDDLVRSGGTLIECAKVLKAAGASSIEAFVPHACFPKQEYRRFVGDGDGAKLFSAFTITDSVVATVRWSMEPEFRDKFRVLALGRLLGEMALQ